MPLIFDDQFPGATPTVKDIPKPSEATPISETFGAAFRQENDVLNAYNLMTREYDITPEPGFDLVQQLQNYDTTNQTNYWNEYRENFLGVNNTNEMRHRISRIEQENEDRKKIQDAGWTGFLASSVAGSLSPTLLLPFVGGRKGFEAVAKGALSLGTQAAVQEIPLQAAQETRGWEDSAFTIGAGTFVGGLIGGLVSLVPAKELKAAESLVERDAQRMREGDMYTPAGGEAISGSSIGAASTEAPFAGGLAKNGPVTGAINNQIARIGPVTDTMRLYEPTEVKLTDGGSYTYRWESPAVLMNQLSDAGLRRAGNELGRPTAVGGTVSERVKMWTGALNEVTERLDSLYAEHIFDKRPVKLFRDTRATVSGWLSEGKMTRTEWKERIGRALFDDKPDPDKFVAKAVEEIRTEFYGKFNEALRGIGKTDEFFKTIGDAVYANRLWSHDKIRRRQGEFASRLAKKFEDKYNAQFAADLNKFIGKQSKAEQTVADLTRPTAETEGLIKKLTEERNNLRDTLDEDTADLDQLLAGLRQDLYYARQSRREATKAGTKQPGHDEAIARISQRIKDLTEQGGEPLQQTAAERRRLNARLQDLNKSRVVFERKQLAKLERIVDLEDLAQNSFESASRKMAKLSDQLDSYSPKQVEKTLKEIGEKILAATERRQKYVDEYLKTSYEFQGVGSTTDLNRLQRLSDQADKWKAKAEELADEFDQIDGSDVELVRSVIRTAMDDVTREVTELNGIRAVRQYRLLEQAKQLDPRIVDERVKALRTSAKQRELDFREAQRVRGADDVDIPESKADFAAQAKKDADEITAKILGSSVRLADVDLLQGERGPALARMLDFPSLDFEDFLELDAEKMMRAYVRTMGPDIEMQAKFGSPNAETQLDAVVKEGQLKHDQIDQLLAEGKLSEKEHKKLADQISADEYRAKENLRTVIQRVRHQRGIPDDPYALDYRAGRVLQDIATARFMGGVLLASIPDVSRLVMKYGFQRAFGQGFGLLVNDLKGLKMASREAKLAGTGLDIAVHQRANALADVFDDLGRYSKFEKGMNYLANKVGQIGLFDHWTAGSKFITSAVTIAQSMDYIEAVVTGLRPRQLGEATAWLAENGIDSRLANKIWKEVTNGGGEKRNGVWFPNTEDWKDMEAVRAYRAMLAREIDDTIITPGPERPKWMDKSIGHKLVAQFKSFTMSSTTKTLMAGLQRPDMAFIGGALMSIEMGMLSYYLWAVATGGDEYQKMLKADVGKWLDEGINRSGVLGVFQLAQDALSRTPARPFVTFSGEQTKRSGGDDLVEFVAGPTLDTLQKTFQVVTGLDDPTKATLHAGRLLTPLNKTFYLRRLIDKLEGDLGNALNLPERR